MHEALKEARLAYNKNEVPVGCIIVDRLSGKIISRAHNSMQENRNPNYHAEIVAINNACLKLDNKNLSNYDIYVTLEPCTMCASAISNARLGRLYYGASDQKQGAVEHGIRFFTSSNCFYRPEIYSGLHQEECEAIIKSFFNKIRKNKL